MKKNRFRLLITGFVLGVIATAATSMALHSKKMGERYGDVNADGMVDVTDVSEVIDVILGITGDMPEPDSTSTYTVNGVEFVMVAVEGGTFTMGATAEQLEDAYEDEKPAHRVTLSTFCIGQIEVTQQLWQAVMGDNPSHFMRSPLKPVENVSWDDCQEFIARLNALTGKKFRLPTEAEWEYAARGSNKSRGYIYAGSNTLGEVAWYDVNSYFIDENSSNYGTHTVATKQPNELGLYDMSGNVWEWCYDWFDDYHSGAQTNPTGPTDPPSEDYPFRVHRGGAWNFDICDCRNSVRGCSPQSAKSKDIGLRLAM